MSSKTPTPPLGTPLLLSGRERNLMGDEAPGQSTPPIGVTDRERLVLLERDRDEMNRRLAEGVVTFQEIRKAFEATTGKWSEELRRVEGKIDVAAKHIDERLERLRPPRVTPLQLFLSLFGVLIFVAGIIWAASRYPERREFDALNAIVLDHKLNQTLNRRDLENLLERVRRLEETKRSTP